MATRKRRALRSAFAPVARVNVYLWGTHLGAVALDPAYNFYAFRYTPEFQRTRIEPAPLHMPTSVDQTFLFTDLPIETYRRLPALLSDALPDDFGNALINRWMADRGVQADQITSVDRLAYMSSRAMGALEFKPARGPATRKPTAIELSELVTEARKAVSGDISGEEDAKLALRHIIEVGTSAGGARAKAVIAWNRATGEVRAGQLAAPPGFEHWLLKFDGMGADSQLGQTQDHGRIEYAYHLMAAQAGIEMTECRLLTENSRAHFMTRRFDREGTDTRHHVQTLCAMAHIDFRKIGANSYSQLFETIFALGLPYEAREEAFRRMVFNALARNCDDHSKNFSFRLRKGQRWELAPAYDVTFAHAPHSKWTRQHLLSINGKFADFALADFLAVADRYAIGSASTLIAQVRAAVSAWPDCAAQAGVRPPEIERIGKLHLPL